MPGWLPRRFRSRALLAILSTGTCLLIVCYYSKFQELGSIAPKKFDSSETSKFWWSQLWWSTSSEDCKGGSPKPFEEVVDTADVYPQLDFAVYDNGGVGFWNEALESRYREIRNTWKDLPLEVIVVPHSHVDPGWLRTYDEYANQFVNHILDNMVEFLNKTEEFRFIWSEVSFFATWWEKQTKNVQNTVIKILNRKQLEIVTGGWVMTDEATTSYFAIIDQLIEGHQWLHHHTNITPHRGWSVDVFGHSASVPYILSTSGITEMVILRAHYAWKSHLAKIRLFDFYWQQPFDSPRIMCHMGPSDLYSFKHTCGPDKFSCLNYDFRRVGGEYSESTADEITEKNIELKSSYLISQYGRYASLFKHNVLLVPLGDDFRYNLYMEWVQQFENYKKLFDFINNKTDWNAHVRFGTVADYFEEVNRRLTANVSHSPVTSLRGDFFPYGDIYADSVPSYWTGYYSTRPFYKKLAQELEHWLRSAEILYSFAKTIVWASAKDILLKDYTLLISARQSHALFQHHDAITGTSKEDVMVDYGKKLHSAIVDAMSVTSHLTQSLFIQSPTETKWTSKIYPDGYRELWNVPTKRMSLQVAEGGRKIILFNSLTFKRTEIVRILVRSPDILVQNSKGKYIPSQINPTWKNTFVVSNSMFELVFVVTLKPLSLTMFNLLKSNDLKSISSEKAVISLFLQDDSVTRFKSSAFKMEKSTQSDITLESSQIRALFSSSGILRKIYMKDSGITKSINIDFSAYLPKDYRSGAYLFGPQSPNPTPLNNLTDHFPVVSLIRGSIISELNIMYHNFLKFSIRLYHFENAPAGLQIVISPDLSGLGKNIELIMRINSDIRNDGVFYTDSNGLQILRRKYVSGLPVQGNYYPATSSVYLEDENVRLTLLMPYSHGVTSPESGTMELMIDRRIQNDDGRGVGQGVQDNKIFSATYWVMAEAKQGSDMGFLSPKMNALSLSLQYPIVTLVTDSGKDRISTPEFYFLSKQWPTNVHLVNMRTLQSSDDYNSPSNSSLMVIHERNDNCKMHTFTDRVVNNVKVASFAKVKVKSVIKTSLTGLLSFKEENTTTSSSPAKLQASKVNFY